ncbi:(R)-1-hydroxy-2-aminoethylphosphonate ammonia-lyase [Leeuwenhoekiella marinoflava]|uniref:4-aminobutyrate aminotransferase n=2 Tax=Leeuwenhoekiella marinoflava TaxID=988 RepID=A0A4Q0PLX6_9FLAO|nr:aspartate aminotransferase family protein [Leeuwenhoekiella marinoflava]RXG29993.1 4-aminobutyrate aminotransferase [Leeuwenhoekiella marinoflava]SHF24096.1 4-aminobutyrate aminotransferase apoenzyme [Leeuwenhoekiella marinoflava DSM 3653]
MKNKLSKNELIVEGDINLSEGRKKWLAEEVDEATKDLLAKDAQYFLHQALSTPCMDVLAHAKGPFITNTSGKNYFDFHGNNVHQIGFSHPKLIEALKKQLDQLTFSTRRYTNETAINFAEKLTSLTPGLDKILMTPNGSSAVGIALKLARAVTGKYKVLSFWDSFHGASLDVVSVSGESVFREQMGPLMPAVEHIPPPITYRGIYENNEDKAIEYLEYILAKDNQIGAFLAETVRNTDAQIPSKKFWKAARKLCDKHDVLLILDEIPIALGRTGKLFAYEHFDIVPDILCLGKGLGGGIIPQAAIVTKSEYDRFNHISLGHYTFEKSPMGAAAALTTLQIIEEEHLLEHVVYLEGMVQATLNDFQHKYKIIGDIRGLGLLWGIELVKDRTTKEKATAEAEAIMYECLKNGLSFKVSKGNVLQLCPALSITTTQLAEGLAILENALEKITKS